MKSVIYKSSKTNFSRDFRRQTDCPSKCAVSKIDRVSMVHVRKIEGVQCFGSPKRAENTFPSWRKFDFEVERVAPWSCFATNIRDTRSNSQL